MDHGMEWMMVWYGEGYGMDDVLVWMIIWYG